MANFFNPSTKKQPTGQVISVLIDRLDHNGIGVGEYKNKPIFIASTLPKEKVTAKIVEAKSKFYKANVIELVNSSEHRVKPPCKHFKTCGGCDLQHLSFQEHLAFKQQKLIDLFSRNNINTNLPWQESITSDALHYRRKARIGVQYNKLGEPIVGFRQKASNNLVQLKECIVLVEPIKHVFTILTSLIKSLSLVKSIGHVEIIYTQHISIIVRQLIPLNEQDKTLWKNIAEQHQWRVYIDNGKEVTPLTPVTPLFYQISEQSGISQNHASESVINIYFEPKDFIQVNHHVNNQMIMQALNWLDLQEDDQVLDLFCGLGNFSLPIARKVKSVVGIEGLQTMVDKATYNAQMSKLDNTEFFQADLNSNWGNQAWAHKKYSKVLLDPARAGAYEALVQLIDLDISHIVYVSCDPATLAKDSQLLINNGYTIEKIAIMDMFAQTKHIETMVLFKK
ncbi:23S rRNA (uracil(1939)-C(5))-methyltransferase RlmD [Pseudocolwellia agarivorans]|uniref:23S rRNA (uracil(1939)-C(5))-methyltransferase RlmD n=1 Tax=Pseudocolwellia agarivorans TaxID=1911682 RepID=UPI0009854D83|nr:23S rRNA (uracil(1939)-C(5))-methyltransferase RlmD [Pseudocolwellia agarivorans]